MSILILFILGYFFGAIPFGLILCRIFGYGDIRKIGSGNIGATNVLRTGNKLLAFITLILDSSKGAISVYLAYIIVSHGLLPLENEALRSAMVIAALGAIIGHCFPVWLKFEGGKGVATSLGGLIAALPVTGLLCCLIWLLSALISRISSLSALTAMLLAPFITYIFYGELLSVTLPCTALSALVWAKHHENIRRILKGEEPRIGKKKEK